MNTFDTLNGHRSIRKYLGDPIPEEDLDRILHAATRASSSGNMQTYSMIVTTDPERKKTLWKLHFEQDMILQAPLLLTFVVDWHRMNRWCRLSGTEPGYGNFLSFLVGFSDAFIAAQNAALAAEAMGYGICYMGTTLSAGVEIAKFLELPESVYPATTLVIGKPDEAPDLRARLPIEGLVHRETYQVPSDAEVLKTYEKREVEGWKRYMSFPDLAALIEKSGVKNLAEVYTTLKYTKDENEEISRELMELLAEAGFLSHGDG
ncbi:MAG: nitroreductase family protein [Candidatus Eisenbacteria bacterium]